MEGGTPDPPTRLETAADDLTVEGVEAALSGRRALGRPVQVYPVAVTTESVALGWARAQAAPEGALVVADLELSARARRGPPWTSVAGKSLAFSIVLRPELPPEGEGLLWLLASVAAAEGISERSGSEVGLGWPDEIVVGDRRLLGMVRTDAQLAPGRIETAILTVRVNVGLSEDDVPAERRGTVTSLAIEGVETPRVEILAAILSRLERRYGASVEELLGAYRSRCETLGRQVRAQLMPAGEVVGRAVDIDERGALVVEKSGGRRALTVDAVRRLESV